MIKVFFLEPTNRAAISLRRYVSSDKEKCPNHWLHNAEVKIDEIDWPHDFNGAGGVAGSPLQGYPAIEKDDPRWPAACAHCGRPFTPEDTYQPNIHRLYKRSDTGALIELGDAPAGAMWFADWMLEFSRFEAGPDGHVLCVRTPGGDWTVDSEASNCTRKGDKAHKCWVRHGDPRTGDIHVDKNGETCGAGAGSIIAGNYHGFLHHGHLTSC